MSDLPDEIWARLLRGYDDPREASAPAGFDAFEAKEQFLELAREVVRIVGTECDVEVWPFLGEASFHGLVELPPAALASGEAASVRASNFGNLVTIVPADDVVRPEILGLLLEAFERDGYRYVPPRLLRRPYAGPHVERPGVRNWADRFFGYL